MSLDLYFERMKKVVVDDFNITHNLGEMAEAAGVYHTLWRPEEKGYTHAVHLIPDLKQGIEHLEQRPDEFKKLNPDNGWGNYEGLLDYCKRVLRFCQENPDTEVRACR